MDEEGESDTRVAGITETDLTIQALYFDIRRGANSVGSSVRDAASYVLWSIARAQSVSALEPFATTLAQTLVPVAVFDREVHIRRAASAAFQEFVGRTVRTRVICATFPSHSDHALRDCSRVELTSSARQISMPWGLGVMRSLKLPLRSQSESAFARI